MMDEKEHQDQMRKLVQRTERIKKTFLRMKDMPFSKINDWYLQKGTKDVLLQTETLAFSARKYFSLAATTPEGQERIETNVYEQLSANNNWSAVATDYGFCITGPALLFKRKSKSKHITDVYAYLLSDLPTDTSQGKILVAFESVVEETSPTYSLIDADNMELSGVLNVLNSRLIPDDNLHSISLLQFSSLGETQCTRVHVVKEADLDKFLQQVFAPAHKSNVNNKQQQE